MQIRLRHRVITTHVSSGTLALLPAQNNRSWTNHTTTTPPARMFLSALTLFLLASSSNCFAESGYTDMGNAFDFFDKMDAEIEKKKENKPVQTTAKPKTSVEKPGSAPPEIASKQSANKPKQIDKKEAVKTPPKNIKQARKPSAPIKKNNFLKRNIAGDKLATEAEQWACVEDANNKLVWEVKTSNGEKQDKNHTYTWYNPEQDNTQNKTTGAANGGRCKGGVPCDTHAYVQAINAQKLCGYSDWRLPTRKEMLSLIGQKTTKTGATINQKYFPEAMPSWYWTASSNEEHPDYAWYVLFRNGISLNDLKERPKHIRLVRGNANRFAAAE